MTKDERAAKEAAKEYHKAIKEFGLDNIQDGWGQSKRRYMMDSFYAGFYSGRDYQRDKASDKKIENIVDSVLKLYEGLPNHQLTPIEKSKIGVTLFNIIERVRF